MTGRAGLRLGYFFILIIILALDRWSKWEALTHWSSEPVRVLPGVRLTFLLNKGIAFSLPFGGWWLLVLTALILLGVLVLLVYSIKRKNKAMVRGLVLILLGAASNSIDRVHYGGVIDFFQAVFLPIINIADLLILSGLLMMVMPAFKKDAKSV